MALPLLYCCRKPTVGESSIAETLSFYFFSAVGMTRQYNLQAMRFLLETNGFRAANTNVFGLRLVQWAKLANLSKCAGLRGTQKKPVSKKRTRLFHNTRHLSLSAFWYKTRRPRGKAVEVTERKSDVVAWKHVILLDCQSPSGLFDFPRRIRAITFKAGGTADARFLTFVPVLSTGKFF